VILALWSGLLEHGSGQVTPISGNQSSETTIRVKVSNPARKMSGRENSLPLRQVREPVLSEARFNELFPQVPRLPNDA